MKLVSQLNKKFIKNIFNKIESAFPYLLFPLLSFVCIFSVLIYKQGLEKLSLARRQIEKIECYIHNEKNSHSSKKESLDGQLQSFLAFAEKEGLENFSKTQLSALEKRAFHITREEKNTIYQIQNPLFFNEINTLLLLKKIDELSKLEYEKEKIVLKRLHLKKIKLAELFETYSCDFTLSKKENS